MEQQDYIRAFDGNIDLARLIGHEVDVCHSGSPSVISGKVIEAWVCDKGEGHIRLFETELREEVTTTAYIVTCDAFGEEPVWESPRLPRP